jgi:hypothetical protein
MPTGLHSWKFRHQKVGLTWTCRKCRTKLIGADDPPRDFPMKVDITLFTAAKEAGLDLDSCDELIALEQMLR